MSELNTEFEVNGIRYVKLTDNTVAVTEEPDYSGDIIIPETVTYNNVKYSVAKIGAFAFLGCRGLKNVSIPNSVTEIGWIAFNGCGKLGSIDVDSGNSFYCSYEGVVFSKDMKTLLICPGGKQGSFEIPDSVIEIGEDAFYGCGGLTSVSIPDSVTAIGDTAFAKCSGLTSIRIPDSVTKIAAFAFDGCGELVSIDVDSGNSFYCSYEGVVFSKDMETLFFVPKGKRGSFEIPDSVTEIGAFAFYECSGLTNIYIPDSVTEIGCEAFYGCKGLTSVSLPDSVSEIEERAFEGCSGLTSVSISDAVTEIEYAVFQDCINLTSVIIPDSVTEIGGEAFSGCCGLKSVSIPDSVTEIGDFAFSGCSRLTSVIIPDSVTKIGEDAFEGCSGLKRIYIGANVSILGNEFADFSAFEGCELIEDISVAAVVPPEAYEDIFDESVYAKATLRVPEAAIEPYKTTEPWSKFATIKPLEKSGNNDVSKKP